MRTWFLTSTTYGTWLPGDERGFVSNVQDEHGGWSRHNIPNTPYDRNDSERKRLAQAVMKGKPICFGIDHAAAVAEQFHETTRHRGWKPHVFAVMATHFHMALTADDAIESAEILKGLKSYASRRLNRDWPRPTSGTWWTDGGSQRAVRDEAHFVYVVRYIANQPLKLAFWIDPSLEYLLQSPERGTLVP